MIADIACLQLRSRDARWIGVSLGPLIASGGFVVVGALAWPPEHAASSNTTAQKRRFTSTRVHAGKFAVKRPSNSSVDAKSLLLQRTANRVTLAAGRR